MSRQETYQFRSWLEADGLYGHLDPYSHAYCALPTSPSIPESLNRLARSTEVDWYVDCKAWPDDDWIIGEAGNGDLYFMSLSDSYAGVWEYDHEMREKRLLSPTLRGFYEHCIQTEFVAGNKP